jgi:hypothetical protein
VRESNTRPFPCEGNVIPLDQQSCYVAGQATIFVQLTNQRRLARKRTLGLALHRSFLRAPMKLVLAYILVHEGKPTRRFTVSNRVRLDAQVLWYNGLVRHVNLLAHVVVEGSSGTRQHRTT